MKIDEKKVVDYVLECYQNCSTSNYRKKKEKLWEECHRAFLSIKDSTSFPFAGCSNVDLGVTAGAIQTFKARLKFSLVGSDPIFQMTPTGAEDEGLCRLKETFMTWILAAHLMSAYGEGIKSIIDQLCQYVTEYGTCIIKYRWQKKPIFEKVIPKSTVEDTKGFFDKFLPSLIKTTRKIIDERGRTDIVSLENFFVPTDAISIEEADYCIHRVWLSENELKERKGVYKDIDKVISWLQTEKDNDKKTATEKVEEIPGGFARDKAEVIEFYGKYEVEDEYRECLFTVAVKPQVLLRAELLLDLYEDDRKPFHRFVFEDSGSFYGRSVPEILKSLTGALNNLYNLSINMGYYTMMPPGFVDKNADVPEKINVKPGTLNQVDGDPYKMIRFMEYPANITIGQVFIGIIQNYIERLLAISAPTQGVEYATKKTAYEVKTVKDEGSVRHQDRIHSLQIEFAKFLKSIYRLYKDNVSEDFIRRVMNDKGKEIFEGGDPDFIILGTLTSGNKFIEREDSLMLYNVLTPILQSPLFIEHPELQVDLLINLLQTFDKKNLLQTFETIKNKIIEKKNEMLIQETMNQKLGIEFEPPPENIPPKEEKKNVNI